MFALGPCRPMAAAALCAALCAAFCCSPAFATPADPAVNRPVCTAPGTQSELRIAPDATGRAVFVWRDDRGPDSDVFAQCFGASQQPLWGAAGVVVCGAAGAQRGPRLAASGDGMIVVWQDARADAGDVYAQRLGASGAGAWAPDGVALCTAPGEQQAPLVVADGAGGAIVGWTDTRGGAATVFARRIGADGAPKWSDAGVALRSGAGSATLVALVPGDGGRAIAAWSDSRGGYWAQCVDSNGVAEWTADGVPVCQPGPPRGFSAIADGAGGLLAAFERTDGTGFYRDLYAQRVRPSGVRAWPDTGVVVSRARYFQRDAVLVSDGEQGAIVAWDDDRVFHLSQVFAQRVDSSGAARWAADGVALCRTNGARAWPAIASDGAGGAVVGWLDDRGGNLDVWAQRVDGAGVPQWTPDGAAVCTAADTQSAVAALPDGAGGATFAWVDARGGGSTDLYAQHVFADGVLDSSVVLGAPGAARAGFALAPPVPNPSRGPLAFRFTLTCPGAMRLRVLDPQGRLVREVASGPAAAAGPHACTWDARDAHGRPVAPGLYVVQLEAEGAVRTRRLVMLR